MEVPNDLRSKKRRDMGEWVNYTEIIPLLYTRTAQDKILLWGGGRVD